MIDATGIAALLKECRTVLISVHRNPDGDALGSQLALLAALEKLGKRVAAHNLDPVPEAYRFLPGAEKITSGKTVTGAFDAMVVLDADPPRTGLFEGTYPSPLLINIDHHVTNPLQWQRTWLDPDAAATGEMIYRLVGLLDVPLDRMIALCLFTAIFTDTGSFRYSNTTPEAMRIAADLIEAGADPWLVTENVYESFAFRRMKLLGHVLAGMERSPDGRIASVVVTEDLYRLTGTTAEDTDMFVNFVRSVKGVEVAVLFRQTGPRQYKISLRSKGRVDLTGMAQTFGGGGHKNAAGAVIDGPFERTKADVLAAVQNLLSAQLGETSGVR
jgi:phosphoesterase RecJ-like protein